MSIYSAQWQYYGFCRLKLKFVFSFLFLGKPIFVASNSKSFSLPFDVYTFAIIKETTLVLIRGLAIEQKSGFSEVVVKK